MSLIVFENTRQPEVHASTLLLVGETLLCAWFGGTKEGHSDTKVWLSRRELSDPDGIWTEPCPVAAEEGLAHWNPVLLEVPETREILLFYKVGSPISSWYTKIIRSTDSGRSWSKSRELVPGDRGCFCLIISYLHSLTSNRWSRACQE
jgi:predicted neuraminidase